MRATRANHATRRFANKNAAAFVLYRTSQLADSRASPFSFAPPDRSGFAKFEIVAMLPQHPYTDIIYGTARFPAGTP